ncbi:hypothetical protein HDF17_000326 [Granulicella arctica]|uniref:Uncharacterized protein n=1 Tax=Granulicella arctica TaxID=940613 RepID=A0A7Y9TF77_9BACT|nr:hypothetical protein [Granulicella arctica]
MSFASPSQKFLTVVAELVYMLMGHTKSFLLYANFQEFVCSE